MSESEYYVRDAKGEEVFKLAQISGDILKESPTYTNLEFDEGKTANYIMGAILKQEGWFLKVIARVEDDEPVGGLICVCQEALFSRDKIAWDVTLMIDAEDRGKCLRELIILVDEYKKWALEQGAKVIKFGVSSGLNIEKASRFLEKMGFARIGAMHAVIVGE